MVILCSTHCAVYTVWRTVDIVKCFFLAFKKEREREEPQGSGGTCLGRAGSALPLVSCVVRQTHLRSKGELLRRGRPPCAEAGMRIREACL